MTQHQRIDTSRRIVDVATGILVGLRGCSPQEAFDELVRVVNDTGMGIGSIATGLVALAEGSSSPQYAQAFEGWDELIRRRQMVRLV
jgi:ANTAR domain